ncbi:uncharacterized protein [Epargyreus clarus]|uniref:uncharacterized protein isoform X2 n=1 Tax=Epargyreus clarus TaxID=520877 RepID=UPI003C2C8058
MKFVALLLLGLVCISLGSPSNLDQHAVALRQKREVDILGNTRRLVEELLQNLQASAQQAMTAISTFTDGLQNQAKLYAEKIAKDMQSLRDRVTDAVTKVTDKFTGAGAAVRVCIDSRRKEADALFSDASAKAKTCADQRIKDVRDMVENLRVLSNEAMSFSNGAMDEMKKCTEVNNGNILAAGTCLGTVAIQSEMKGAVFLSQSGLSIARINLAIATLPAALDVCAGTQLVSAGVGTARIVMEIGSCSASSIFSSFTSFTGNSVEA